MSKSSSNIRRNTLISWGNWNATTRAEPTQNNTRGTRAEPARNADADNARNPRKTQTRGTRAYY